MIMKLKVLPFHCFVGDIKRERTLLCKNQRIKQEGMTFDHDFCYFILLFSSLLKKEGREKENDVAKIVTKSHTFLFHQTRGYLIAVQESII